ncbi:MAG: glutamate 5-kinase [Candidatus Promineifilaceae bacterium]|nr:glutamate 5-kinase [Candidatus Promineifilaceae bacterium]
MYQRIVIKFGTSVLTGGTPSLDRPHMVELVRQCAAVQGAGTDVIVCTSGAIAVGHERLGFPELPPKLSNKQMMAAVGQSRLMQMWERFFEIYGIHVGQILLTRSDVEHRGRFLNARDTLNALLNQQIVPIVNENDAVTTEEIKVGDNDNLSALVTILAGADLLLILTDQRGLFTADPRTNPDAQLIPEVKTIDETLHNLAGDSVSGLGVGGMITKLQAADAARRAGADVMITSGRTQNVITRAAGGELMGTHFPALEVPLENRKRWIFAAQKVSGSLTIDDGAAQALSENGRSLLPAGIVAVSGTFERGDTLSIQNSNGKVLARGITRYSSHDLNKIAGCQSDEFEARLGYIYGSVAIHRNDLILL